MYTNFTMEIYVLPLWKFVIILLYLNKKANGRVVI